MIVREDWHSQERMLPAPAPASDPYRGQPADAGALQTSPGQADDLGGRNHLRNLGADRG
jgi:hypothetical protein